MVIRFAEFELDDALYQLRSGGEIVKLEPKVFDLLAYLVRHRERVVSKDELLQKLWPGEHVSESVLPTNVRTLRRALGDDRTAARFVETVYGRGYRFIATVESERDGEARVADAPRQPLFVGRERELALLRDAFAAAASSRGSVALLVGEAGIGKTRLTEEIAGEAARRGARVLTGRCHEGEGAPAFWPWIQILRELLAGLAPEDVRRDLGREADEITPLLPELMDIASGGPEAPRARPRSAQRRFQLFDAVARYLRRKSRIGPLLVVLDDLHWADPASLLLLHFLTGELRASAVLLIGTYRDDELHRSHPLTRVLGEMLREPTVRRIPLKGLEREEVARYLEGFAPQSADGSLAARLHERTAGNPFFLRELVHAIDGEGAARGEILPEGIREAIGRRLSRLPAETNRVLTAAAFVGDTFAATTLEPIVGLGYERLLEILDQARARGVLREAAPGATRYAFAHALVRETLYHEVSVPMRVRMHQRVGEAIEATVGHDSAAHVGELAHHFYQAAAGGEIAKAVLWGRRAAERAMRLLAWEEAAAHDERILELVTLAPPVDERIQCELLLDLGDALSRAGERDRARDAFARAGVAARVLGDATLLARAALGLGGRAEELHGLDDALRRLLEEALAKVGDADDALRAALLARLAGTHPYSASPRERQQLAGEAVTLARRSKARWALAQALVMRAVDLGPGEIAQRLALGAELVDMAREPDDTPWGLPPYDPAWVGHIYRQRAFLLQGDLPHADRELAELARLAEEQRQPFQRYAVCTARFGRALASGRFAEARQWMARARTVAERLDPLAGTIDFLLQFLLARECGVELLPAVMTGPHLEDALRGLPLDRFGWAGSPEVVSELGIRDTIHATTPWLGPVMGAIMGHAKFQQGRLEEARRELSSVGQRPEDLPRDGNWLFMLALAAEVAVATGDRPLAKALYVALEPHAACNASHEGLDVYFGSVQHFLGILAAASARRDRAVQHLEAAFVENQRMGARAHQARSQIELARALGRGGGARARALLEEGRALARELGMKPLLDLQQITS